MRVTLIGLILLNVLLAVAQPTRNTRSMFYWDCCKMQGPDPFCCLDCCWFIDNCDTDADCRDA